MPTWFLRKILASEWGIPYPMLGRIAGDDEALQGKYDPTRKIQTEIQAFLNQGHWSPDQNRYYLILRTLQDIKADMIADCLTLYWRALWAFGVIDPDPYPEEQDRAQRLARFMVLCAGVKRTLDMGFQDHPRPSLPRRWEQGGLHRLSDGALPRYRTVDRHACWTPSAYRTLPRPEGDR